MRRTTFVVTLVATTPAGCGNGSVPGVDESSEGGPPAAPLDPCGTPGEGCACEPPGKSVACGTDPNSLAIVELASSVETIVR